MTDARAHAALFAPYFAPSMTATPTAHISLSFVSVPSPLFLGTGSAGGKAHCRSPGAVDKPLDGEILRTQTGRMDADDWTREKQTPTRARGAPRARQRVPICEQDSGTELRQQMATPARPGRARANRPTPPPGPTPVPVLP